MLMNELFRRVRYLLQRRRFDQELANDLDFHREMADRAGSPLRNTLQLREAARDAWGWTWIDRFAQDLRYAVRMLRKSPGFTLAAVLMLAIGIGVNVAVFGFFDLMVLRPPFSAKLRLRDAVSGDGILPRSFSNAICRHGTEHHKGRNGRRRQTN
jgi:hypothetical protein